MNKNELIETVSARLDVDRKQVAEVLNTVIDTIARGLAKGEKFQISDLGVFEATVRPAGWARNPQTGDRVRTKKRTVPKFRPATHLKQVTNGEKKLGAVPKAAKKETSTAAKSRAFAAQRPVSTPAKKAAPAARKATPAKKAAPAARKATPAKKAAPAARKATPAKKAAPAARKATPAKKAAPAARKATPAKKAAPAARKATPAKKAAPAARKTAAKKPPNK